MPLPYCKSHFEFTFKYIVLFKYFIKNGSEGEIYLLKGFMHTWRVQ
jgi:hypothetical protein